ncbi:MAG: hypothetical protein ACI87Q_000718 [Pseudohongiellaceae bacterium]|jgi:hypothetical protein
MPNIDDSGIPEVVTFLSGGQECKAFFLYEQMTLNMRTCTINLGKQPSIKIEHTGDICRVRINEGEIWFDTSEQSAEKIESLLINDVTMRNSLQSPENSPKMIRSRSC